MYLKKWHCRLTVSGKNTVDSSFNQFIWDASFDISIVRFAAYCVLPCYRKKKSWMQIVIISCQWLRHFINYTTHTISPMLLKWKSTFHSIFHHFTQNIHHRFIVVIVLWRHFIHHHHWLLHPLNTKEKPKFLSFCVMYS